MNLCHGLTSGFDPQDFAPDQAAEQAYDVAGLAITHLGVLIPMESLRKKA
jgi:hypothetical protein